MKRIDVYKYFDSCDIKYRNCIMTRTRSGSDFNFEWQVGRTMISWWPAESFGPDINMYGDKAEEVWQKDKRRWANRRFTADTYCRENNLKHIPLTEHMSAKFMLESLEPVLYD